MELIVEENSDCVATCFRKECSTDVLNSIQSIASDAPSNEFFKSMCQVCPNLWIMRLDPVHLCITYNASFWKNALLEKWLYVLYKTNGIKLTTQSRWDIGETHSMDAIAYKLLRKRFLLGTLFVLAVCPAREAMVFQTGVCRSTRSSRFGSRPWCYEPKDTMRWQKTWFDDLLCSCSFSCRMVHE